MKEQAGRPGRVTPSQPSGEFNFVQVSLQPSISPSQVHWRSGERRQLSAPDSESPLTEMCGDGF